MIRNAFGNDGYDSMVVNCRAENCSNVSLDCGAGGTSPGRSIVYGNKLLNPDTSGAFTHGISVENVNNSVVANNTVVENDGNGPRWNPAINVNVSSHSTVVGNTVENVGKCVNVANGPAVGTVIADNTFLSYDQNGVLTQESTDGPVRDLLITDNSFESPQGEAIRVDKGTHADVVSNTFRGHSAAAVKGGASGTTDRPMVVRGNAIRDHQDGEVITIESDSDAPDDGPKWASVCGNLVEFGSSAEAMTTTPVSVSADRGLCANNVFGYVDVGDFQPTLALGSGGGSYWLVSNNYVRTDGTFGDGRAATIRLHDGVVSGNIIENGNVEVEGGATVRDNAALSPESTPQVTTGDATFPVGGPRSGTYDGDGSTGRLVRTATRPEYAVVEAPNGTKFDVHAAWGTGYRHDDPPGDLALTESGFEVSAGGASGAPNASGDTCRFYVR